MDRVTFRYAAAAAIILATVTIAVSAFAESALEGPAARPVDPNARLPVVIRLERFLNRNGIFDANRKEERATAPETHRPDPTPIQSSASPKPQPPPIRKTMPVPDNPPMVRIAAPNFDETPPVAHGAPAPDASVLYAPPVPSPWWERLFASREFLYGTIIVLFVVPAGYTVHTIFSRRREDRDLAFYD